MKLKHCFILLLFCNAMVAQPRYNAALLDSALLITKSNTPSVHFARLYYPNYIISNYANQQPLHIKEFIFAIEASFYHLFFAAHHNYISKNTQSPIWKSYYSTPNLNELQYQFLGINAHINGDMWVAITSNFTYDSIKANAHYLFNFQKQYSHYFDSIYALSYRYKKVRYLHHLTLGLDKYYGRKMIYRWRKRQVKLAMLWYSNNPKCLRKVKRVQRKMNRLNRFAIKYFK